MNNSQVELMSKIFRELDASVGSRDLAILFLEALRDSIENLKIQSADDFHKAFGELVEVVSSTEPRFGSLNYQMAMLLDYIKTSVCSNEKCSQKWRHLMARQIKDLIKSLKRSQRDITQQAQALDVDGKTILIHDHSHTVQDILVQYKRMGKKFKVVIAEQNFEKTQDNIERLHHAGITFQVVPSYMLSHMHDSIDMVFFGALTLKDTMHFVMSPGAHGIISEFHLIGVPVFLFIDASKFSLWKSKPRHTVFMHKHERQHNDKAICYERIKYSHDRVPVSLFTKIITNEGVFTPEGIKKSFEQKMQKYSLGS